MLREPAHPYVDLPGQPAARSLPERGPASEHALRQTITWVRFSLIADGRDLLAPAASRHHSLIPKVTFSSCVSLPRRTSMAIGCRRDGRESATASISD